VSAAARLPGAIADAAGTLVLWVPGGIGSRLRRLYFRMRGARIGPRVRIEVGVLIDRPDLVEIGSDSWIDRYAILIAGPPGLDRETRAVGDAVPELEGRIRIGPQCHIGANTILSGIGGLDVGGQVTLAAGTKVYSLTHHYRSWADPARTDVVFGSMAPAALQSMLQGPVRIEDNVGVGVDCVILPGVTIGSGSFVRPRSVVTSSFEPNSLIAGDPARREGARFAEPS